MDRDFLIKLCLAVYRVTDVFPEKEPLRFLIREKANQILADLVYKEQKKGAKEQVLGNIEVLKGYFEVAKSQKWLREENFLVLVREYDKIGKEISEKPKAKKDPPQLPFDNLRNERSRKILELLKQKEKVQVWELKNIFPQFSKRTLRRDFDELLKKGLVQRIGDGKGTFYRLKRTLIGHQ